jgi:hypothetical protein
MKNLSGQSALNQENLEMEYGNKTNGVSMGDNAGKGNRAVASHIKGLHAAAGHSGNSVSSTIAPSKTLVHAPGAASSVLKTPHPTPKPMD